MTKREIRKQVLAQRDQLTAEHRLRSEILLTERILGHQWYYRASKILLFKSFGSEISTQAIFEDALQCGKEVFFPKVEQDVMNFYKVTDPDDFTTGYKGIPEPDTAKGLELFSYKEEQNDTILMIMPGVAFDIHRNRVGYGKGYYDRYLEDKEKLHTIAIGFDCQMVGEIPAQETDIRPMQVICL